MDIDLPGTLLLSAFSSPSSHLHFRPPLPLNRHLQLQLQLQRRRRRRRTTVTHDTDVGHVQSTSASHPCHFHFPSLLDGPRPAELRSRPRFARDRSQTVVAVARSLCRLCVVFRLCRMAAAPSGPHRNNDNDNDNDSDQRDLLAHAYLNDPNFDVDAELCRRSSGSQRRRAAQSTALNTPPSIRRRPTVFPLPSLSSLSTLSPTPSSSSPRVGFPLIPHNLPTPLSFSRQPHLHSVQDFAPTPQPAPSIPSVSLPLSSSFISDPNPAFNGPSLHPNPNHRHSTAADDEYYDIESIAPSTSPHRFSTEIYSYYKKHGSNDDYAMEMDTRSQIDFEEYVFLFPSTTAPIPNDHLSRSSILPHLSGRVLARPISLTPISCIVT